MNTGRYISVAVAGILCVLPGCNTTGCTDNRSALPLAGFYSAETHTQISPGMLDVHGVGAPGDSMLLTSGTQASQIYLPMHSSANEVEWCFHYTQTGIDSPRYNDTITFGYTSEPYFASEECGAMYCYTITSCRYTTHLVDSVAVIDSLITNTERERIKIYFRTVSAPPPSSSAGDGSADKEP